MKNQILSLIVLFAITLLSVSCSSDDNNDSNNNGGGGNNDRKVRYEITGNFTGRLLVVTSTNTGALEQFNNVSLPWTKELAYQSNVTGAGLSLQTENNNVGAQGQTVTLKVYLNNELKDTKNATADATGKVNMAMAFYTF